MLFPQARRAVAQYADQIHVGDPRHSIDDERAAARARAAAEVLEDVAVARDVDADGVAARLLVPSGARPGLILHLHGGGFVFNDVVVHEGAARRLANRAGTAVLSVDYRRPPEHRFPAAPDDVDTVLAWLASPRCADELPALCLNAPLFAHGDSAGGNLALVAALRNPGRFAALGLIYPFLDPTASYPSYGEVADGFSTAEAAWYWEQYARTEADLSDPDLAPLLSRSLASLPPTVIVTCEHDPLRDEGEDLALRLVESGVKTVSLRFQGMVHGIWRHPQAFDAAETMMRSVVGFFDQHR